VGRGDPRDQGLPGDQVPHVIGCLWPSVDWVCVELAREFCGWGLCFGRGPAGRMGQAVMAMRKTEMDMPLIWAQFVHFGA
jgi:hypothetical protein